MELLGGELGGHIRGQALAAGQEGAVGRVEVGHHKDLLPLVKEHLAVVGADAGGVVPVHQAAGGAVPAHLHRLVVQGHRHAAVLGGQGAQHRRGGLGLLALLGVGVLPGGLGGPLFLFAPAHRRDDDDENDDHHRGPGCRRAISECIWVFCSPARV